MLVNVPYTLLVTSFDYPDVLRDDPVAVLTRFHAAGPGLIASATYTLAQGELVATVIPGFPQWGPAGLVGSLAWLAFLMALGGSLLRAPRPGTPRA